MAARASDAVARKYGFLEPESFTLSRVFVTSGRPKGGRGKGPWDRLETFCTEHQIELLEINTVIRRLARQLLARYPGSGIIGKEPTLSRFLLHLIHAGFINRDSIAQESGAAPRG